jgi:hypothetical protein
MKKGLAVLYSQKNLADFICYYTTTKDEYEWDVCVEPYADKIVLTDYCRKAGVFSKIFTDEKNYWKHTIPYLIQLFFIYVFGRRKTYSKKLIENVVGKDDYDVVLICVNNHMLEGALLNLADERKTVILEDGMLDYLERYKRLPKKCGDVLHRIMWQFLAKSMSMSATGNEWIENTKYCDKYVQYPEKMKYTKFKSINRMSELLNSNKELYDKLITKTFDIDEQIRNSDIVLFTTPLAAFVDNPSEEIKKTIEYIACKYPDSSILLKKHPRDKEIYDFPQNMRVNEIDSSVPAELVTGCFEAKKYIFMYTTTTLLQFQDNLDKVEVFFYKNLDVPQAKYPYKKNFIDCLRTIGIYDMKKFVTIL